MNQAQLEKFFNYLKKEKWLIFGPTEKPSEHRTDEEEISPFIAAHLDKPRKNGEVLISRLNKFSDLILDDRLPFYSFKRFFVPAKETLFEYKKERLGEFYPEHQRRALIGINILDLKAVNLYDQVFEKDSYYQRRRRDILIIGHSLTPEINQNIFSQRYEEDVLEHLPFDIFLAATSSGFKIFTGSIKGQRILEHFGYRDYEHIQFSGPVREGKLDGRMVKLRDKLENHHNQKIWDELGKICLECGKCTLVCPTCFCFSLQDEPGLKENSGSRQRCWDSCYYQEFTEVAGPDKPGVGKPKFLNNTAQRIHFWYNHKFSRIPREFDMMGCVGCHRCTKVCPVGIDIEKVLKEIENS